MGEGEATVLLQAFTTLLPTVAPERRDRALRLAIRVLVSDGRIRLGNRSPTIGPADLQRWSELKPRLRAYLAATKIGMSIVAQETELPLSSVQRALSPAGPVPGRGIIDLLNRWLEQQHIDVPPKPARAGAAPSEPSKGITPRVTPSGNSAPPAAGPLSIEQRERLAGIVSLMDVREIRTATGVGEDAIGRAISGESLDAAIVARLVHYLAEAALGE